MTIEKDCGNCGNRCMDMDLEPYCSAVNKPWGQTIAGRPRPPECGPEGKLWQLDTRGSKAPREGA